MNLFHWLRKKPSRIGLALSGGALHGAAHIGALRVLEREGIFPSIIAGTSVGAIIGAAYAAGISTEEMSKMFQKMGWPDLIKPSLRNSTSLFSTQPMEAFIRSNIGNFTFETLPRKFAVVTCDLMTGKRTVINKGSVSQAVRASAAYPIILSPVQMNDQFLIDGGVVDNLPAGLVKEMGSDYIIGIDLSSSTKLQKKPSNLLEIAFSVINIMQTRSAFQDASLINCRIHPIVNDLSAWSFGDSRELEKRGQEAAEKVLNKLKKDLGKS
jgi:NTE family protein